jgi:hypothetical protein
MTSFYQAVVFHCQCETDITPFMPRVSAGGEWILVPEYFETQSVTPNQRGTSGGAERMVTETV